MAINNSCDFFIQWHLTERCNLRCRHCYQTGKGLQEMPLSGIRESINEISDTLTAWKDLYGLDFSSSFNITGGEPFLRQDIFEVLAEIREKGFEIYLLTNGTLLNRSRAAALAGLGVKGVQVSIEGPEKIHDPIRGRNSFAASVNGIRDLLDAGLTVTMNMTLSALNAEYFPEMFRLSSDLGVQKLGFSRLVPSGMGRSMAKEMLGTEEVKALYNRIFSMDAGAVEIVTGDPVATQSRISSVNNNGDVPLSGCAAGISGLTIMPDGTVLPCRRLPVPIGNIRNDSLRELWAMSGVLNGLRDRNSYKGRCGNCERWAHCRGCRAIAYAYTGTRGEGDLLAEDPQCFIDHAL
ncbi:MAG: radical SAM protein [Nitrospirota bacterium]|nr:radical SAM protein [Nitrospirota bacterium]